MAAWLTLAHVTAAHAGAWTQNAGGWFVKLGIEQWETEERFDLDAARVDYLSPGPGFARRGDYRNQALRFYVEHGVTSHWTVTVATAVERARARGDGRILQNTGLSDLTVQLKRRLTTTPVVISAIAEVKLPTGYDTSHAPALGSGRIDGGGRLAVGRGFGAAYLTGEAGFRVRDGRSNEYPFALETGVTLMGTVMLRAELSGVGTRNLPAIGAVFDPARAESRHMSGGLGLVLLGDPLDFVLGADQVLWGRNALAGTRFSFSVWLTD